MLCQRVTLWVFTISIAFTAGTDLVRAQVYDSTGFEAAGLANGEAFTLDDWRALGFDPGWSKGNGWGERAAYDTTESYTGRGALRLSYPKDEAGTRGSGAQIPLMIPDRRTVYASYRMRFSEDFDWGGRSEGGKLPGLAGMSEDYKICSGGRDCDGGNGFSARLMWRAGGRGVLYLYHMDKPGEYGEDIALLDARGEEYYFPRGAWVHVAERLTANSFDAAGDPVADGRVQVWIDGELAVDRRELRVTTDEESLVNNLYFSSFHGGSGSSWAPGNDSYVWFDDIRVAGRYRDVAMSEASALTAASRIEPINISPNPADEAVVLGGEGPYAVAVYDGLGREVAAYPAVAAGERVDVSALAPGVYTLRASSGDGVLRGARIVVR